MSLFYDFPLVRIMTVLRNLSWGLSYRAALTSLEGALGTGPTVACAICWVFFSMEPVVFDFGLMEPDRE